MLQYRWRWRLKFRLSSYLWCRILSSDLEKIQPIPLENSLPLYNYYFYDTLQSFSCIYNLPPSSSILYYISYILYLMCWYAHNWQIFKGFISPAGFWSDCKHLFLSSRLVSILKLLSAFWCCSNIFPKFFLSKRRDEKCLVLALLLFHTHKLARIQASFYKLWLWMFKSQDWIFV